MKDNPSSVSQSCEGQSDDELKGVHDALQRSDTDIARVTEDLIYLLVQKNIILFTELPDVVQAKLLSREKLRDKLSAQTVPLLSDDETI